jgi:hypothetical protein
MVWFGEDSDYSALTFFNAKDQLGHKKADSDWHSFIVWSGGNHTKAFLDGQQIAETSGLLSPNSLTVETRSAKAGRQTEVSVTNVHCFGSAEPSFTIFGY